MSGAVKAEWTKAGLLSLLVAVLALVAWGFAIASFGYAAIIVPALVLAFASLIGLIFVTRG